MEIRKKFVLIISILFVILSFSLSSYAGWTGPTTIVAGTWGTGTTQFGLEHGDTSDSFPDIDAVLPDGRIIIHDGVNKRFDIYNMSGVLINNIYWYVNNGSSGTVNPVFSTYQFMNVQGYTPDGNIWMEIENDYLLKTPTGTLLTTSSSRPMELGILSQKITGTSHYKRIEYPDGVYFYYYTGSTGYFKYESELFRVNSNLILDNQGSTVYAFTATAISTPAGQKQQYQLLLNATWNVPQNQYKVIRPADNNFGLEEKDSIIAEYGEAVIGPDGSIYTWVRSDTDYKIVKWTWSP
jgi:hypothetical protein